MVVSRCRGIGPPSGIPSSGLCFCWLPIYVVIQLSPTRVPVSSVLLVWPVPRGVSVIPRAVSLRVSISQSTGYIHIYHLRLVPSKIPPGEKKKVQNGASFDRTGSLPAAQGDPTELLPTGLNRHWDGVGLTRRLTRHLQLISPPPLQLSHAKFRYTSKQQVLHDPAASRSP